MPRNAEIMPRNRAVRSRSPHLVSRFSACGCPLDFFQEQRNDDERRDAASVITQATAVKAAGLAMGSAMLCPRALSAVVAAGSS